MKLFINNVSNLIVQTIIAFQLTFIFCCKSIFAMKPDLITKIAAESENKKLRRQKISEELKILKTDNILCKQYFSRVITD